MIFLMYSTGRSFIFDVQARMRQQQVRAEELSFNSCMTAVGQWQIHHSPLKQMHLLKLQLDAFSFRASAEKAHWLLAVALQDP